MELESSAGQLLLLYAVELQLSAVCRGAEVVCLFFVPCLRSDSFFYAFVLVVLLAFFVVLFHGFVVFSGYGCLSGGHGGGNDSGAGSGGGDSPGPRFPRSSGSGSVVFSWVSLIFSSSSSFS